MCLTSVTASRLSLLLICLPALSGSALFVLLRRKQRLGEVSGAPELSLHSARQTIPARPFLLHLLCCDRGGMVGNCAQASECCTREHGLTMFIDMWVGQRVPILFHFTFF